MLHNISTQRKPAELKTVIDKPEIGAENCCWKSDKWLLVSSDNL